MDKTQPNKTARIPVKTVDQISAGGVAFRPTANGTEVALIKSAAEGRWQLPKGIVDPGETPEQAALREVSEEAGITCLIVEPLDIIEYWFFGSYDGERKRYHKHVHFFLMSYISGDVADHDDEVSEARWVPVDEAASMLAFKDETRIATLAAERLKLLS